MDIMKSPSKQRTVSLARSIVCYLAVEKLMISGAYAARILDLCASAASKSAARGRMDSLMKQIENDIFDFK
ncbi:MAG: hypothetical protein KAU38_06240 [Desulfobacterales bacterium]|nr:hypothetical protein [Desulfobacterales bacterium]